MLEISMQFLRQPSRVWFSFLVGRDHCLLVKQQMTHLVGVEEPLVQKYLSLRTGITLHAARGSCVRAMVMGYLRGQQVHGPHLAHHSLLFAWSLGTCTRSMCPVSLTPHLSSSPLPSPPAPCLPTSPHPFLTARSLAAPPLPTVNPVYKERNPGTNYPSDLVLSQ